MFWGCQCSGPPAAGDTAPVLNGSLVLAPTAPARFNLLGENSCGPGQFLETDPLLQGTTTSPHRQVPIAPLWTSKGYPQRPTVKVGRMDVVGCREIFGWVEVFLCIPFLWLKRSPGGCLASCASLVAGPELETSASARVDQEHKST